MAYIDPQVQLDMQQDQRASQNYQAIGNSIIGALETNRQRALEARRAALEAEQRAEQSKVNNLTTQKLQYDADQRGKNPLERDDFLQSKAMKDNEFKNQLMLKNMELAQQKKLKEMERGVNGKGTVGEQSVDRNFAKTYDDFIVGGGYTKVERGLKSLEDVASKLGDKNGPNLTGGLLGRTPDFIAQMTGNSDAVEARDQVGTIIQDNLRSILGPAYTEREGENVIRRAYDPTLSEAANKKKLDGVINQMREAARAKVEAAKYYEQNGSLRGYKGTVVNSVNDIFNQSGKQNAPDSSPRVSQDAVKTVKSMSDDQLIQQARQLGLIP